MRRYQTFASVISVVQAVMPSLPYHNFGHAMDVYTATRRLGSLTRISSEDLILLETAALLHDGILIPGAKDNEERTAEFARRYLLTLGYTLKQVDTIASLILATKIPTAPQGILQEILCDADLDNLGRDDYFVRNDEVRREIGIPAGKEWWASSLQFLQTQRYYTRAAQTLREKGKERNKKKLEEQLQI